jgi:hypothetical protein
MTEHYTKITDKNLKIVDKITKCLSTLARD